MNDTIYIVENVEFVGVVCLFVLEKKKKRCINKRMISLMDCLRQLAYIKGVSVTFIQFLANDGNFVADKSVTPFQGLK